MAGPSPVYSQLGTLGVGQSLDIICTVYNRPPAESAGGVWDYTDQGWVADHFVRTGTDQPVAPACTGSVSAPAATTSAPDPATGPFPIRTDPGTGSPLFEAPSGTSNHPSTVGEGTFVHVGCSTTGNAVGGPEGMNNRWDQIDSPVAGWVPDALVLTIPNTAPPQCSGP